VLVTQLENSEVLPVGSVAVAVIWVPPEVTAEWMASIAASPPWFRDQR